VERYVDEKYNELRRKRPDDIALKYEKVQQRIIDPVTSISTNLVFVDLARQLAMDQIDLIKALSDLDAMWPISHLKKRSTLLLLTLQQIAYASRSSVEQLQDASSKVHNDVGDFVKENEKENSVCNLCM